MIGYSENTTIFINSFEEFNKFKDIISNEFSNLDKSFKKSKEQIIKNNYEEDIKNYLFEKLYYIKNITANYYNSINDIFYEIKDYLVNSILDLNNLLNECENITYIAFSEKYQTISKEVQNLDKDYNIKEENLIPIIYNLNCENYNIKATAKFEKLIKKAKFKYYYNYEKGSSPIMRVELIDEGKPEKLNLEIEDSYGDCGNKIQEIEAEFGNVSFITYIDYNISTNKINMTTITNFESYDYTIVKYKKDVSS